MAEHNQGFESTTVDLPKDVKRFKVDSEKPRRVDVLSYVTKNNPYADPDMLHWERTYYIHGNIGPDQKPYVCPEMESDGKYNWPGYATGGKKKCPVCREIQRLMADHEENKELIDAIKLKERQLFNVRDCADASGEIQVWDIAHFLFGEQLDTMLNNDEDEEYQDFSDWENGLSLKLGLEERSFTRPGATKKGNPFFAVKTIEFKTRKEPYDPEDMEKKVHCLDDFIKVLSPDELKKIFLQTTDEDEETRTTTFGAKDVKKIKDMRKSELKHFALENNIELSADVDDFDDVETLRKELLQAVKDAMEEKRKPGRPAGSTKKPKPEPEPVDDDDVEDDEDEDEDADESDEDGDEDSDESDDDTDEPDDDEGGEDDSEDDDEDESDDDEDEEDEDEPPAKPARKPGKRK